MAVEKRSLVKTLTPGIYKRGGRYVVILRDQQRRQVKRFARTLAEARDIRAELQADIVRGEYHKSSTLSFERYARDWIASYTGRTGRGIRDATKHDYERVLERHAIPFFGTRRLTEIEPRDIKRYVTTVSDTGIAPNTVRLAVAPVRALFATAVEEGLIRSNPCTGLRLALQKQPAAGDEQEESKALTEEQLQALLAEVPPQWQLVIEFLASSGLRIGEAAALQWRDVNFNTGQIRVQRRLYRGEIAAPKSRYGRRTIPLPLELVNRLRELYLASGRPPGELPVFASQTGTPLDSKNLLNRVVKPAAKRAGLPWVGLHTLRHTCASLLFKSGWNAKQVQLMLGHHSPAFTLATYVHLMPEDLPRPESFGALAVERDRSC